VTLRGYVALALSGLPLGAMYAMQAMGIVLVYKTSRTFNFAQGAIGMAAGFLASAVSISAGLPAPVGLLAGVTLGVVVGLAMELTVRPLRGELPRTVATLAWLLALQGLAGYFFGTSAGRQPMNLFPSRTAIDLDFFRVAFGWDQIGVLVVAAAVAAGLGWFFRTSALGVAMRAVAGKPEAARILGVRANRVTQVSWMLGAGLGALSGVLVTPLLGTLDTITLIVFTVQALAAALVGGLTSLPLTFVGGIALGIVQPVVGRMLGSPAGINELLALVVILAALLFRKRTGRVDVSTSSLRTPPVGALPTGARGWLLWGGVPAVLFGLALLLGRQGAYNLADLFIWSLAVLSIVLLTGVVGQISLCQAVFMAVGGFGAGIAVNAGAPSLVAIPLGALLAAATAAVVGLPALRLRGLELAVATLALAFTADRYFFRFRPLVGADTVRPVPRPAFADQVAAGLGGARWFLVLSIAVFLAVAAYLAALRRARNGIAMTAMRGSEVATAAVGFSTMSLKLRGFALSGFIAGLAGGLFAMLSGAASSAPFGFTRSISLVAFALIAGVGSIPGAVLGGGIVVLSTLSFGGSSELASGDAASLVTAATGVALAVTLLVAPDGIAGALSRLSRRVLGRPPTGPPAVGEPEPAAPQMAGVS
jgi:branched-chain amino acid transport system permease protein